MEGIFKRQVGADATLQFSIDGRGVLKDMLENFGVQQAVADGKDNLLLALGAVKVAAGGGTGAGVGQGEFTGQDLAAGLEVAGRLIAQRVNPDGFGDVQLDAANQVNETHEGVEVHHGVVINRHAKGGLDGGHSEAGAAAGDAVNIAKVVGGVDFIGLETGDVGPQVTRDGEDAGVTGDGVNGEQDHGVAAAGAGAFIGGPIAVIQPHDEHGDAVGAVPGFRGGRGEGEAEGVRGGRARAAGRGGRAKKTLQEAAGGGREQAASLKAAKSQKTGGTQENAQQPENGGQAENRRAGGFGLHGFSGLRGSR